MTRVERDGASLYYEAAGDGEVVAFLGDAGYGAWQWGWQHRAVVGPFAGLVTDLRGTGRSDPPDGPLSVPQLANDVQAVLRDRGADRVHLVGAGLGGMIALRLALTGGRPASLTLLAGAASGDGPDLDSLSADPDDRTALRASTEAALSADFADRQPEVVERIVEWRAAEDADPAAWAAQRAAVEAFDCRDRLHEVTVPALVIHGADDPAWPVARGRALAEGLPRGEFVALEGASHLVGVERSRPVNDRLLGFLEEHARSTPLE